MTWFPVKSGFGTRTSGGGFATQPTGTFADYGAANVYDNIAAAITDGATSLDDIICSDVHNKNYGASVTYTGPAYPNKFLRIWSVDDSAMDALKSGAREDTGTTAGSEDITLSGRIYWNGARIRRADDIVLTAESIQIFENCTIVFEGSGDFINGRVDGALIRMINSNIELEASLTGAMISFWGGSHWEWIGGAITGGSFTTAYIFDNSTAGNGGFSFDFYGVDLSKVTTAIAQSLSGSGADVSQGKLYNCKIPSGTTLTADGMNYPHHRIDSVNFSALQAGQNRGIFVEMWEGTVESQDDAGIHRNETDPLPNGNKFSLKVTTNGNASIATPLRYMLPAGYYAISATPKIRSYFASESSLHDNNVWMNSVYSDSTDIQLYKTASSKNANPLGTGTAHTDDSGSSTWKNGASDLTGHNEYRMDNTLSSGSDGVPMNFIQVAEPSITVYFDVIYDAVA